MLGLRGRKWKLGSALAGLGWGITVFGNRTLEMLNPIGGQGHGWATKRPRVLRKYVYIRSCNYICNTTKHKASASKWGRATAQKAMNDEHKFSTQTAQHLDETPISSKT